MRVMFVDILRLLALLQMVNGHTLDAVLQDGLRTGVAFERYGYVRGLVSVAFMVVAGISFHLTTVVQLARHRADAKAVRRRFTRALQIVAIGYLLQAHTPAIYFDPVRAPGAFRALFRCEVLQCIGISLLVLELIALRARSAQQVVVACAGLALVLFSLAPLAEVASRGGSASLLKGLLGHGQGSQFPLFPWSGYVFAGVVIGAAVLPEAGRTTGLRRVGGLLACAAAIAILARATVSPSLVQASSTPSFVLEKLSVIALVLCALELLSRRVRKLPRVLTILGGETLAIFVFHLQLIYGGKWAFAHRFGRTLDWPQALAVASLNIVASIAFGLAWYGLKQGVARVRKRYASLSVSQADCSERSVT